ncbi:uncharacterized protein LOC128953097 [Oppia nitens]|uniref:uncharacterized protein LOC128953097 n=1 Tax=Oppia nitens TaxID=1686743 RepID=UPI0023DCB039|nr:uncharacterized protein LOC128953097 [Oppia nitens]
MIVIVLNGNFDQLKNYDADNKQLTVPDHQLVPNYVHYVLFRVNEIQFQHFISILSVLRNQRPDRLYIHCDCRELVGQYYRRIQSVVNRTGSRLIVRQIQMPTHAYGTAINSTHLPWHASDIVRVQVLRKFGGIYLDRDVYVIKSFDEFFKYPMTLDFQNVFEIGNQVLIGHPSSQFLRLYYQSFSKYDTNKTFYFNAGVRPVLDIVYKWPKLIHRMTGQFGVRPDICRYLYTSFDRQNWESVNDTDTDQSTGSYYYSAHLLIRGNDFYENGRKWCLPDITPAVVWYDEQVVRTVNNTFAAMYWTLNADY